KDIKLLECPKEGFKLVEDLEGKMEEDTMATEAEVTCPVCQGSLKEPSVISPCQHQFCFGCIMRWAKRSVSCPLCSYVWLL
uniref:RING-type domain-containing protein n=1 Tax=Anas platyrhynchos TaxID=8839 RepID=A0A8B9T615_ANAPL